jgi:anti-anti-sigma factor
MERILLTPVIIEQFGSPPQTVEIPLTRLDAATAETFRQQCLDAVAGQAQVVGINLSTVEFLDSKGLGALVSCSKHRGIAW